MDLMNTKNAIYLLNTTDWIRKTLRTLFSYMLVIKHLGDMDERKAIIMHQLMKAY